MDPTTSSAADPIDLPPAPWRRPLLIISGLSLLAIGAFVNAGRLGLADDEASLVAQTETERPERFMGDAKADEVVTGQRHRGEEGKMGKPTAKHKSGLYAARGPADADPQDVGILGLVALDRGHFLASPDGGAYAVGGSDQDVWGGLTGTEVGEGFGVAGTGLAGTGRGGGGVGLGVGRRVPGRHKSLRTRPAPQDFGAEEYAHAADLSFVETAKDAKSTFSIDVDTASYSNLRRFLLREHRLPPTAAVRTEELVNYFEYGYETPAGDIPFGVTTEVGPAPWNQSHQLVQIGVRAKTVATAQTPPRNLVFLVDVSGSMSSVDKLPVVQAGLHALADQMRKEDRISIAVYAGAAGSVLAPTRGDQRRKIHAAIDDLASGGSTNGTEGIHLAYRLARKHFIRGGINRVILATDGDFNVGTTDHEALIELIEAKRRTGVFLSVLGVGTANLRDHMMEQLADKGNGNYAYLDGDKEARKVLVEQSSSMLHTIAKDVKIQVSFDPDRVAQHRLVGYENRVLAHEDFRDDAKDAGEIGAGHTVTAIYEVVPTGTASDDPIMTLDLRYKQPNAKVSQEVSVAVAEATGDLDATSEDYRFASAVAMFGQKLRGNPSQAETSWAEIGRLASEALGEDPSCRRHEFLLLVDAAARLHGDRLQLDFGLDDCPSDYVPPEPSVVEPPVVEPPVVEPPEVTSQDCVAGCVEPLEGELPSEEREDWRDFVLAVLRLLPPLLALPLFLMAFRRPRRRRG